MVCLVGFKLQLLWSCPPSSRLFGFCFTQYLSNQILWNTSNVMPEKCTPSPAGMRFTTTSICFFQLLEVFDDGLNSPATAIYSDDDSYGSPGGLLSP